MNNQAIPRKEGFSQVCVWPGCVLGESTVEQFEAWMLSEDGFGVRVQYLENIDTDPDIRNGNPVPETGNRSDMFFAVHQEDIGKFAVPRLQVGIRWIEDVLADCNHNKHLYVSNPHVYDYVTWNQEAITKPASLNAAINLDADEDDLEEEE